MFRDAFVRLAFKPTQLGLLKLFEQQEKGQQDSKATASRPAEPELTESKLAAANSVANSREESKLATTDSVASSREESSKADHQMNGRHVTPSK